MKLKQPSYGTILIWTKKAGLFTIQRPKEKAQDWVLIMDESIDVGHERLMVIYGIRASKISFDRALTYTDLTPFFIKLGNHWNAETIKHELENIISCWGNIKYIVADGGNAICKGIRLLYKIHVYDITHKIAWLLKKMYENNESFISLTKEMSQMRFKCVCSDVSHIIPPKQRTNSRFMNLDILSQWGIKGLRCINSGKLKRTREYEKLQWLLKYKDFIMELASINHVITEIQTVLKTKGLSKQTIKQTNIILSKIKFHNQRTNFFKEELMIYLKTTKDNLPDDKNILCTSDIIESSFGKYKNYIAQNSMIGITNLSLCLAAFTNDLDAMKLKEGLERTTINDLKNWTKDNIGETNLSKRRRVLL